MNRRSAFFLGLALAIVAVRPAAADLWALSIDPYGTAPPADAAKYNKVLRFDNAGNVLANDIPSGTSGLSYPSGIATGPDGNLYVSSGGTASVLYFNGQTGAALGTFAYLPDAQSPPASAAELLWGPDGKLYVSELQGTSVRVYNSSGVRQPDAATGLNRPGGLLFLKDSGDLLVGDGLVQAEGQSAQVLSVHQGGAPTKWNVEFNTPQGPAGAVYGPSSMLQLANGDVLIPDLVANYIWRFSSNGFPGTPFAALPSGSFPSDIKYDADGNIVVSLLGATVPGDPGGTMGGLLRYDLNGNLIQTIASSLPPIGGIAWTPAARTLVGDYDNSGSVTSADYAKWAADFGKLVAAGNGADGNNDGVIDAADYTIWRDHLRQGGLGAGTSVPEPATGVLLILGGALTLAARMTGRFSRHLS